MTPSHRAVMITNSVFYIYTINVSVLRSTLDQTERL
jgi:hypothetical protein